MEFEEERPVCACWEGGLKGALHGGLVSSRCSLGWTGGVPCLGFVCGRAACCLLEWRVAEWDCGAGRENKEICTVRTIAGSKKGYFFFLDWMIVVDC